MSGTTGTSASNGFSMFFRTKLTQLGALYLDVLVTENLTLPSEVTKYPIEDGSGDISDHITQNNEELNITGAISSASSFGVEFGPLCYSKMIDAIATLRKMHKDRKVIRVVTGLGKYDNMAFTALTINRGSGDKGGQWLDINASLRKIKKVALKKTDLPAESSSAKGKTDSTERKSGKNDKPASTEQKEEGFLHKTLAPTKVGQSAGLKP